MTKPWWVKAKFRLVTTKIWWVKANSGVLGLTFGGDP